MRSCEIPDRNCFLLKNVKSGVIRFENENKSVEIRNNSKIQAILFKYSANYLHDKLC